MNFNPLFLVKGGDIYEEMIDPQNFFASKLSYPDQALRNQYFDGYAREATIKEPVDEVANKYGSWEYAGEIKVDTPGEEEEHGSGSGIEGIENADPASFVEDYAPPKDSVDAETFFKVKAPKAANENAHAVKIDEKAALTGSLKKLGQEFGSEQFPKTEASKKQKVFNSYSDKALSCT